MNRNKGFSIISAIVAIGVVAGISVYMMDGIHGSNKSMVKNENKFNASILNAMIISRIGYEDSCNKALNIGTSNNNNNINKWNSSSGGDLDVGLNDSTVAKSGASMDKYNTTIESLKVINLAQTSANYGYIFYTGDVIIANKMNKNILLSNNSIPKKKIGQIQFLVDSSGNVVACASKGLEDSPLYLAAKAKDLAETNNIDDDELITQLLD